MMARLEMLADIENGQSHYKITVEQCGTTCEGARLVVERFDFENDSEPSAFQGIDLTQEECAVLGAHLTALAGVQRG